MSELVDSFNALAIPNGYVHVDRDDVIHVVIIWCETAELDDGRITHQLGVAVAFAADVIWHFDPQCQRWKVIKGRYGVLER